MPDTTTAASRYRKLPVEIEAIHFDGTPQSILAVMRFVDAGRSEKEISIHAETVPAMSWIGIPTLEGTMRADAGDWIVRGVKGELYPCKPDVFAVTYEAADAAPAVPPSADRADLRRIREVVRRLAAHAAGFQDVLDESDRGPWGKTVAADIEELRRLADEAQPEPTPAPVLRAAQQIRTDAALRDAEGETDLAAYGRELADLISPEAPAERQRPVSLATTCGRGRCGHAYNWHDSRGACEFGNEINRCGCNCFVPGKRPEPVNPLRILGIDPEFAAGTPQAEAPAATEETP